MKQSHNPSSAMSLRPFSFLLVLLPLLVLASGPLAVAQWQWNNPTPQGNDLWCAEFSPASSTCWAVGGGGMILVSGNGGQTWSHRPSGTMSFLRGLAAPTTMDAWVVGDDGTILFTQDGGFSWTPQPSGVTLGINEIFAISSSEAWVVGDAGMVRHTTNGGALWSAQTSNTTNNLNDIFFVDAQNGWAVGASKTIRKTTNGGQTWTSITIPGPGLFDLIGVFFVDAQNGWAAGTNGTILCTTNGGAQWTRQTTNTTTDLNKVRFLDLNTGVTVGELGTVLFTTNGGQIWVPFASGATNGLEGLASSGTTVVAVGVFGGIYTAALPGTFTAITTGSRTTLNGVTNFGAGMIWAVGDNGDILASANGGASWSPQVSGTTQNLYGASATDANNVWVCGAGGTILYSANGGMNWSAQPSGTTMTLNTIRFISPLVGFAAGVGGTVLRTTNGGGSWIACATGTSQSLYAMHFEDPQVGTVVGANGTIIITVNGGQNWYPQQSYTQDALFGVFTAGAMGTIVGDAGAVLISTDYGVTWDTQTPPTSSALYNMTATIPGTLCAVGDNGSILRSDDWGYTWTKELSYAQYALYGVSSSAGRVVAVGDFGMTLSSQSYPTPVELQAFSGQIDGRVVHLRWSTASETGNAGFRIQRLDGDEWRERGFLPGAGTSVEPRHYAFSDTREDASRRELTYRLIQRDYDGTETLSPLLVLSDASLPFQPSSLDVTPNPSHGDVMLRVRWSEEDREAVHLFLHDLRGIRLADLSTLLAASDREGWLALPRTVFPSSGTYFLHLQTGSHRITKMVIVQ